VRSSAARIRDFEGPGSVIVAGEKGECRASEAQRLDSRFGLTRLFHTPKSCFLD
jgi:hypothetical protein